MGGIINVIMAFLAVFLLYDSSSVWLTGLAVLIALIAIWSWGMMLRYSPALIKLRLNRLQAQIRTREDLSPQERDRINASIANGLRTGPPPAPRWLLYVNAMAFIGSMLLLVWGALSLFRHH